MDPSAVKLFYNIKNTTALTELTNLVPLVCGAWGFFRRMRVICGGQIIEDIDNYNRTHEMIHMMKPTEKRVNDAIEDFGDSEFQELNHASVDSPSPIPKGHTQTVCFTPLSGLLSQDKFLPIRYCPIQLEFELVGTATDAGQGSASAALHPFLVGVSHLKSRMYN